MDKRLMAFSRKAAEIAADPNRDSAPVAQRHIDRFNEIQEAYRNARRAVDLERGWMLVVECGGHPRDDISAACHLVYEGGDECWSRHGLSSTEECRVAVLELVDQAERDGFQSLSRIVAVSAIADGSVEKGLEAVRRIWRK